MCISIRKTTVFNSKIKRSGNRLLPFWGCSAFAAYLLFHNFFDFFFQYFELPLNFLRDICFQFLLLTLLHHLLSCLFVLLLYDLPNRLVRVVLLILERHRIYTFLLLSFCDYPDLRSREGEDMEA